MHDTRCMVLGVGSLSGVGSLAEVARGGPSWTGVLEALLVRAQFASVFRNWYFGLLFRALGCGLRVAGSGFLVPGFRVPGSGFRVPGSGFRVPGSGFRVPGSGFSGSGFRVPGSGFRVQGLATSD